MESPMNIEAPTTPSASNTQLRWPSARCPNAISDSVPPSPLLSARSSSSTYLAVTTMNSDHRISESTPSTIARDTGAPLAAWVTASRNAYSGDVPISPNTTPMLPSVRAQKPEVTCPSWASVDVTLTVMMKRERSRHGIDPRRYLRFRVACQSSDKHITSCDATLTQSNLHQNGGIMVVCRPKASDWAEAADFRASM